MFAWYQKAEVCIAYLSDVRGPNAVFSGSVLEQFRFSRWFERGWTLQELIAPAEVLFVDAQWRYFGKKTSTLSPAPDPFIRLLSEVSRIPVEVLTHRQSFRDYSVAQRMSWASTRSTTREEDAAYCLLGLFSINMPLLYGEGSKAFRRLQHIILGEDLGESIFAWRPRASSMQMFDLFASSPAEFANSADIVDFMRPEGPILTRRGVGIELRVPWAPQTSIYGCEDDSYLLLRLSCGRVVTTDGTPHFATRVMRLQQALGYEYYHRSDSFYDDKEIAEDEDPDDDRFVPLRESRTLMILPSRPRMSHYTARALYE